MILENEVFKKLRNSISEVLTDQIYTNGQTQIKKEVLTWAVQKDINANIDLRYGLRLRIKYPKIYQLVHLRRSVYVQLGRQIEQICNEVAKKYRLAIRQNYTAGRGWHMIASRKTLKDIPSDFVKVRHTKYSIYFTTDKLGPASQLHPICFILRTGTS